MLVAKESIPVVAVDIMNQVHAEEIVLLNELDGLITRRLEGEDVNEALGEKINDLLEHVEYHFTNEERMMRETGVPVYPIHKGEHDRVRADLNTVCADWKSEQGFARFTAYIRETIPPWFANHVATMDTVTAQMMSQILGH